MQAQLMNDSFLSSLLPPTPETVHHVLSQVGFSSRFEEQDFELSDASLSSSQDFGNAQYEALYPLGVQPPLQPLHSRPRVQDPQFTALLDETRSIATSSDFSYVLEVCLDRATDLLFSGLEESVFASSDSIHGEEVRIRLAGLLPDLARWSQLALRALPNELIDVSCIFLPSFRCLAFIDLPVVALRIYWIRGK